MSRAWSTRGRLTRRVNRLREYPLTNHGKIYVWMWKYIEDFVTSLLCVFTSKHPFSNVQGASFGKMKFLVCGSCFFFLINFVEFMWWSCYLCQPEARPDPKIEISGKVQIAIFFSCMSKLPACLKVLVDFDYSTLQRQVKEKWSRNPSKYHWKSMENHTFRLVTSEVKISFLRRLLWDQKHNFSRKFNLA